MNSAISNLIILTADVTEDKILGTAIDGDIKVLFAVDANEVNQRLFLPEANLVVSGKFRLSREACSVNISIVSVIAVVCLPVAAPVAPVALPIDAPTKSKRKTSTTSRSNKATKTPIAA
jgi:hypothetical protein